MWYRKQLSCIIGLFGRYGILFYLYFKHRRSPVLHKQRAMTKNWNTNKSKSTQGGLSTGIVWDTYNWNKKRRLIQTLGGTYGHFFCRIFSTTWQGSQLRNHGDQSAWHNNLGTKTKELMIVNKLYLVQFCSNEGLRSPLHCKKGKNSQMRSAWSIQMSCNYG